MRKFPFLRRPVKPVLYAVLLALVSAAALVFGWQYHLDGIMLEHAIDTYAYVGTIVRSDGKVLDNIRTEDVGDLRDFGWDSPQMGGQAFLEELPEGLVQWLSESEYVSRIDSRQTQAALLGDYYRTNTEESGQTSKIDDLMMSIGGSSYYFLEATVDFVMKNEWRNDDEIAVDDYRLRVERMWSDPNFSQDTMTLKVWCMSAEPQFEVGQRLFLIGDYVYYGENGVPSDQNTVIDSPEYMRRWYERNGGSPSVREENSYILIPEGVDSEQYILDFLESTGLGTMLERQLRNQYSVTVRRTGDMKMIPLFAKGKAKTYEGRVLTPADAGKKVCVISNGLSQRNQLSVGDTIRLSLADGCYTIGSIGGMEYAEGWETGNQGDGDTPLTYGAYEEYEIVGIYTQAGRRTVNSLYFPYGDIFLPAEEGSAAAVTKPYTFSFKVPGPDYQSFLTDFQPVLDEYGYTLVVEDTGWDDVKESFYTMQTRRQLMLLCAAAAFAAAVAVFAILLNAHCSYEYGLRRLLGASKREARGIYGAVFGFTAVPGAIAAVLLAWVMAVNLMQEALAADKTVPLPTDLQCAGILAAWAAAELAAAWLLLMLLARLAERRGLLKLTRR